MTSTLRTALLVPPPCGGDGPDGLPSIKEWSRFRVLTELRRSARPTELAARSIWRPLWAIVFDWMCIATAIRAIAAAPWWLHPALLLIIAARQHALLILMHDASHFSFSSKRWLN